MFSHVFVCPRGDEIGYVLSSSCHGLAGRRTWVGSVCLVLVLPWRWIGGEVGTLIR